VSGDAFLDLLDAADRAALDGMGRPRRFVPGEVLLREGARSDHVVLLLTGRTKVVGADIPGREVPLGIRGPGELVGEFAVIEGEGSRRSASVVAMTELTCRVFSGSEFRTYLEAHPRATLALLRSVFARLREVDRRRMEFGRLDVSHRVAQLLVDLAARADGGLTLAVSQDELAGMVGASRESVVRTLRALRATGLVATERRSITVLDPAALRGLA
jgi:CRP/FNR family cyclic AMP-dependent transcriptional regulator